MQRNTLTNSDTFENRIKTLLKPVNPDPTFVAGLSHRLVEKTPIRIEGLHSLVFLPLLVAAGLFSGALILWILNKNREINHTKD